MKNNNEEMYWVGWMKLIDDWKKDHEILPIDTQIHDDWLMVPGYNGIKVNVEKSLCNLEKLKGWDENSIVLEEIEPHVKISNLKPSIICCGNPNKPMISFMINVAWGNEYLIELLRILKKSKVKATFFLDGTWIYRFPMLGQKIINDGHEIGNHAYSHPDMRGMNMEDIRLELKKTNEIIQKELGVRPTLFTPPSGEFDERVVYLSCQESMYTILSTIDTLDWQKPNPKDIIEKIKLKVKKGAIILMHPTESSMLALPEILKAIMEKQLKIGTVSELLSTERI